MPNNIGKRGLTDREMLQLCLELEKGRCRSVSNTMLETSHNELREIYQQCFENANNNHYSLYEKMNENGWYKTDIATTGDIHKVQEFMQNNLHPDEQF
ncbi:spore coat protein CotF [Cytobacillus eiseniae]|uniref:Spore coat protein CotF n=1 Tax=Cytobacillus eiseniae TaxID=762947 RepID=A0ABS4RAY4_9BACI|nr:spore coat protein [Cytobacillus eiseniae]MBP2239490.1 spore coat protein CotF [Cytobacillus eiseniae]